MSFLSAGIISAVTWPASLVTLASVIDNPWGVCCRRSAAVGRQLAILLQQRQHGRRPVTLIGFSLGARVIYYCLKELVNRQGCAGIVQDVILLGAPVPGYPEEWKTFGKFNVENSLGCFNHTATTMINSYTIFKNS